MILDGVHRDGLRSKESLAMDTFPGAFGCKRGGGGGGGGGEGG